MPLECLEVPLSADTPATMPDINREPKVVPIAEVWERISEFAADHRDAGSGYYSEEPYKNDFFEIFADAFYSGFCGRVAWQRLETMIKRRKRTKPTAAEVVVSGELIGKHLRRHRPKQQKRTAHDEQMIDDLSAWWDEWTYAWSLHPSGLPRKPERRPKG